MAYGVYAKLREPLHADGAGRRGTAGEWRDPCSTPCLTLVPSDRGMVAMTARNNPASGLTTPVLTLHQLRRIVHRPHDAPVAQLIFDSTRSVRRDAPPHVAEGIGSRQCGDRMLRVTATL